MIKEFAETKSPHVILFNKTFNNIKLNVIMLTRPRIKNRSKDRKIFYDIKYMGQHVLMNKNGKYYNLNPSMTKRYVIFIVIAIHEMKPIDNFFFSTEKGEMIPESCFDKDRHGFVLLAAIQVQRNGTPKILS